MCLSHTTSSWRQQLAVSLLEQKAINPSTFPAMLAVGQIATIAWLLKDQAIPPEKAGRELLTNCFAVVKPDAEWFGFFREGMEQFTGPLDEFARQGTNALTVQAARRIAQEESFGNSTIVRQLNMAEILSKAEEEKQRLLDERDAKAEEERRLLHEELLTARSLSHQALLDSEQAAQLAQETAVKAAAEQARQELIASMKEERRRIAIRRASYVVFALRACLLVALVYALFDSAKIQIEDGNLSHEMIFLTIVLALINVLAFADLLKFPFMETSLAKLRELIAVIFGAARD
jgi:hypothetical protein